MFGAFRSTVRRSLRQTARTSGGHSGGPPFHGFNPPYVAPIHKNMGEIMMGVMWFWIFYRAKEDGMAVLGFEHPWDHGSHGHDDHGHDDHGHGDTEVQGYIKEGVGITPEVQE